MKQSHLLLYDTTSSLNHMAQRALTATQVSALDKDGVHWIAPSLYLQIRREQGTRSYLFRYGRDGENQWLGLARSAWRPSADTPVMP